MSQFIFSADRVVDEVEDEKIVSFPLTLLKRPGRPSDSGSHRDAPALCFTLS